MTAILKLEDGTVFHGQAIGVLGTTVGELVFNTAMTGYQEVLTDPSYAKQIINFTYPSIGNTGINLDDNESIKIWAAGVVVRENSSIASNWRSVKTFSEWLSEQGIVGIAGVNTRRLTKHLRDYGNQLGCITALASPFCKKRPSHSDCGNIFGEVLRGNDGEHAQNETKVVVIDFGVKNSILTNLTKHNCAITIISANTTAAEILKLEPDGIVLSNGPGDPRDLIEAIANIKKMISAEQNIPILGICLGFQLLALALGADIFKMKFGHHGANHPVQEISDNKVFITSQNHNYAVVEGSIPDELIITHRSLFDQTVQGLRHKVKTICGYQWHPEAGPGPADSVNIFQQFIKTMQPKVDYAKTQ